MQEQEKYYCADCGRELTEEELAECLHGEDTNGETIYVCADCADNWRECADCGCLISPNEIENGDCLKGHDENGDDIYVCEYCKDNWRECERCGAIVYWDEVEEVVDVGEYWCESCRDDNAWKCERCGDWLSNNADSTCVKVGWGDYEYWCDECCEDNAFYCESCDTVYSNSYYESYSDRYGNIYCEDCYNEYCDDHYHDDEGEHEDRIWDWHEHKDNEPIFYGKAKNRWRRYSMLDGKKQHTGYDKWHTVGFENEMDKKGEYDYDCEENYLDDMGDILGDRVYFERDGSVGSKGIETISQPHTVEEFWRIKDKWAEMLASAKRNGYISHDAVDYNGVGKCGLHIHIAREMFGSTEYLQNLSLAKIIMFTEHYYNEIHKISRRGGNPLAEAQHYHKFYTQNYNLSGNTKEARNTVYSILRANNKRGDWSGDRYYSINLTNHNTVEFRFFRGTLNEKSFFASFDFIFNLVKNAKRIKWADVDDVSQWLKGMNADTLEYIKSRHAFENVLGGDAVNTNEEV